MIAHLLESHQIGQHQTPPLHAVEAFEQILDAIPNDRVALETLFEAYEQIGQTARAVEYLVRLGQSVCEEQDTEAAPEILAKLRAVGDTDPAAGDLVEISIIEDPKYGVVVDYGAAFDDEVPKWDAHLPVIGPHGLDPDEPDTDADDRSPEPPAPGATGSGGGS